MTKLVTTALLVGGMSAVAYAQKPATTPAAAPAAAAKPAGEAAPPMPMPPKPGPETEALKPFAKISSMTGAVPANAMGNPAELPVKAKANCKWTGGNFWVSCDLDQTVGTGKTAMHWYGHWTYGYDLAAKAYRGVMFSSDGEHMAMKGTLDGAKITWESAEEHKVPNMPSKIRVTEDATDPKAIKFTEEGWMNGKWMPLTSGIEKTSGK